jgi:N-formylglutamate amidohydrolase
MPAPNEAGAIEIFAGRGGPVVLSVPHSGRHYPAALVARSRFGRASLERLEDPHVDLLVTGALDRGVAAVIARAPRAEIDINRSLGELHPAAIFGRRGEPPTPRARAGLGLIPTRVGGLGDLWRAPIDEVELERRISNVHCAYHDALAQQLSLATRSWAEVSLLDCHSMPPRGRGEANVIIGDRHGTSAASWVVEAAEAIARRRGFTVGRNDPFAGGHIIERHGDPARGVHAIQIEIDRAAYCERDLRTPGPSFDRVALLFETLASELGDLLRRRTIIAAE